MSNSVYAARSGPRLEYVLRKVEGHIEKQVTRWDEEEKCFKHDTKIIPGGYLLYTSHHAVKHLTEKEVKRRGLLDRDPEIINFNEITDQKSNWGIYKYSPDPKKRMVAYRAIENELVKACENKFGPHGIVLVDAPKKEAA